MFIKPGEESESIGNNCHTRANRKESRQNLPLTLPGKRITSAVRKN
jgi:hypothetical protein